MFSTPPLPAAHSFFYSCYPHHPETHSFPTRRSSDLEERFDKLAAYTASQFEHMRVEACDTCKTYINTVDLTKNGLAIPVRSEEHTSELQSLTKLVCRLLLEKKKKI